MTFAGSLPSREGVPFCLALLASLAGTLAVDARFHTLDPVSVGKWLDISGVLLICGSFGLAAPGAVAILAGSEALKPPWRMALPDRLSPNDPLPQGDLA